VIWWKSPPLLFGAFLINDTYVRIWKVKFLVKNYVWQILKIGMTNSWSTTSYRTLTNAKNSEQVARPS